MTANAVETTEYRRLTADVRESEMIKELSYCVAQVVFMAGCCKSPQIPEADTIDNIEINYGATKRIIPPDIVVTNHAAIREALCTLRQLPINRWHGNRMILPETDLTLGFNQGTNTLLVVWLSTESVGARRGGEQYKHNRWCDVPKDTISQLKRQLGLNDQKETRTSDDTVPPNTHSPSAQGVGGR